MYKLALAYTILVFYGILSIIFACIGNYLDTYLYTDLETLT